MQRGEREIVIYYNPELSAHRQTIAYARSEAPYVEAFAFDHADLNATRWEEILTALGLHPSEILNEEHPFFIENLEGRDFDEVSWIKIIMNNPELVKAPIAVRGQRAILCLNPKDVYRLHKEEHLSL